MLRIAVQHTRGVLILEGMAQLAGLLLEESLRQRFGIGAKAVLTVLERTKFRAMVGPGDTLRGLMRRIGREVQVQCAGSLREIQDLSA